MRLTIVGCSGSFPGPDSPASCYLLEAAWQGRAYRLLLDFGSGALGALQRVTDALAIDAVALSHLHPDHCMDLCGYYVMRRYHPSGPQPPIPVWGPVGTAARLARAYGLAEDPGMTNDFEFGEWGEADVRLGPFTVRPRRVNHPVEAYALRVTDGSATLVYSGDTGACEALVDLARGTDALLTEATFVESKDNPPDLHLTGREAAEHAQRAGVGRLLLTHIAPWTDPALVLAESTGSFDGPIALVEPEATYEI